MKSPRRMFATSVAALTVPWLVLAASPAHATSSEAAESAAWLSSQIQDDGLLHGQFGADYGLTADALITLDTLGGQAGVVTSLANTLAADPGAYITGEAFGDEGSTYAGATGKLTVAMDTASRDLTSVGGINLVERLESIIEIEGADTGRGVDVSVWNDYSNGVGQSWVVRGLIAGESDLADEALEFFLAQQCSDGGFRVNLDEDGCTSSFDLTAYAVVTLLDAKAAGVTGTETTNLDTPLANAVQALLTAQTAEGSLLDDSNANANTTGLAAWALRLAGQSEAADAAVDWLRTVYLGADGPIAAEAGAIAFDRAAFDTAVDAGEIASSNQEQWLRATVQAALAWAGASDAEAEPEVTITVASTVTAGEEFTIEAEGFGPGESVIVDLSMGGAVGGRSVSAFKLAVLEVVDTDDAGALTLTATAPEAPGDYTLTLTGPSISGSAPMTILAAATGGDDTDDSDQTTGNGTTTSTSTTGAGSSNLPNSGSSVNPLLLASGLGLVGLGAAATVWARRRFVS